MENTINFEDIGNLKIFQLGYVYKDAEKQAKIMESQWGMAPFAFMDHTYDIEFLEKGREGLQHVSCMVNGLDSYIEALKQKGIDVIQSDIIGKQYWAYFDTENTLGIMLELQETLKRKKKK